MTEYARSGLGRPINPTHIAIDITGWKIMSSNESFTGSSFHITASSVCALPGTVSGCALPPGGDTGIPPIADLYSFSPFPGYHVNIQVNQLP